MSEQKKFLVLTADNITPCTVNDSVALEINGLDSELGLTPGCGLLLRLAPGEARLLADALRRKADEAEARSPQPVQNLQEPPRSKH